MGNNITVSIRKSWFKFKYKLQRSNPNHITPLLPLPDDVSALILNKLDAVSLCRCTLASKQGLSELLPVHVRSISTTLPRSIFLPGKTTLWYGKILYSLIRESTKYFGGKLRKFGGSFFEAMFGASLILLGWIHTPRISPSARRFFKRFRGLKLVELEVPAPPSSDDYLSNPGTWLRWDVNLSMDDGSHLLFVLGDIIETPPEESPDYHPTQDKIINPGDELFSKVEVILRHLTLHLFTPIYLSNSGIFEFMYKCLRNSQNNVGVEVVSKDAGNNGKLRMKITTNSDDIESNSNDNGNGNSKSNSNSSASTVCYVPTSLTVSGLSLRMKNVWLFFSSEVDDDSAKSAEDFLREFVGEFDDGGGVRRELKEVVLTILGNDLRREINDPDFFMDYIV